VMKSDHTKDEDLLVNWIAKSLRRFLIVEVNGLQDFVDILCTLCRQFSVPRQSKVRNILVAFGELMQSKRRTR